MEADSLALRTARLDAVVEERIATLASDDGKEDMYSAQQKVVLEALFADLNTADDSTLALQGLRAQFTTQSIADDGETPVQEFDELAYKTEIRRQLIDVQPLPETELTRLARERADNTRVAILENDANLQDRINILEIKSVAKKSDEMIKMKVSLSTGK